VVMAATPFRVYRESSDPSAPDQGRKQTDG
jgi:hypothetical protein